jgi:hypothetical protein
MQTCIINPDSGRAITFGGKKHRQLIKANRLPNVQIPKKPPKQVELGREKKKIIAEEKRLKKDIEEAEQENKEANKKFEEIDKMIKVRAAKGKKKETKTEAKERMAKVRAARNNGKKETKAEVKERMAKVRAAKEEKNEILDYNNMTKEQIIKRQEELKKQRGLDTYNIKR